MTIEGLKSLQLLAMGKGLLTQRGQPDYSSLSFEERLGLLVDAESLQRQNRRLEWVFKAVKLAAGASSEDVDFARARGLDKATFMSLVNSDWVEHHHNVIIFGPTGVSKTYLACALAHSTIQGGHSAIYVRTPRLLSDLAVARGDGRIGQMMASFARFNILILDFLLRPFNNDRTADLPEAVEDYSAKSTIASPRVRRRLSSPARHIINYAQRQTIKVSRDRRCIEPHRPCSTMTTKEGSYEDLTSKQRRPLRGLRSHRDVYENSGLSVAEDPKNAGIRTQAA